MASYYISSSTGSDSRTSTQAQNSNTPWQTLSKVNTFNFSPGDTIYFKRGDTFNGFIQAKSGTAGSPITYDSYGTGELPIFNGFTTLSTWTLSSGNIYYASNVDVARMQIVTLDGVIKGMGRYPKTGYLKLTSHVEPTVSITGTTVGTIPFNPATGEAVVKKARYILDVHPITSRSGNTLNLTCANAELYGNSCSYSATDQNGYFIQNHIGCLTQDGDWFYDNPNNRFYMYFSTPPSSRLVKVGTVQTLVKGIACSYFNVKNLELIGAGHTGINIQYGDHILIDGCKITKMGYDGVYAQEGAGVVAVTNCIIEDCLNNGVIGANDNHYFTVSNNSCNRIHTIAGMGKSGDLAGIGIVCTGDNFICTGNSVTNIGYNGIAWYKGNNALVQYNYVDNFCTIKDDGGGIYTYGNFDQTFTLRTIDHNIVINGFGNTEGIGAYTSDPNSNFGLAPAIYIDNYGSDVDITDNFLYNGTFAGIFINSNTRDKIRNNTIFNFPRGIHISHYVGQSVSPLQITGNNIIAKNTTDMILVFEAYQSPTLINSYGNIDNNRYTRPISEGAFIRVDDRRSNGQVITDYTISQWRAIFAHDFSTVQSLVPVSDVSKYRVEFNATGNSVTRSLGTSLYKDIFNTSYSTSVTLAPYTGKVLIYDSEVTTPPPVTGKIFRGTDGKIFKNSTGKIYRG